MAATIKDIIKMTGLGGATISAYLNGVKIRPANKVLIENAIKELGYVRNEYARGLKTRRTMTVGVLIPELSNVFSTTIISELEDVLRKNGYGVIVCDCRTDEELERKSLNFLISKMVDGLIIIPIKTDGLLLNAAIERNIPIVVMDRLTDKSEVGYVVINNMEISKTAVSEVINKGHKRIALISGSPDVYTAYERSLGYRLAMQEAKCLDEELIFDGNLSVQGGYLSMKSIIDNHPDVTALFVTNYEMTLGAIIAMNECGKRIPNDFSFVGFDNHELSKIFSPKLATVNQPLNDIGKRSAEQLLAQIGGESPIKTILEATFEKGASILNII